MTATCSAEERAVLRRECLMFFVKQRERLTAWAARPIPSKRMIDDGSNSEPREMDHPDNDGMSRWMKRHETRMEGRR